MKFKTLTLLLIVLVAVPVSAQDTLSDANRDAIHTVLQEQEEAWNRADIPAFMEGYWKSDQLVFVGSGGVVSGWEATRDRYLKNYPDAAAMGQLRFEIIRMQQVGPGVAQVLGKFILDRSDETLSGYFTLVWKKFDEGWRIVSDHTSSANP
ncbi:YybH family protein [Robertkochia sediminum]|uniref:YybH family protein n=1 Tax=Robertkochia sediminum TaxID=2785326 RepID=UPI001932CCB1|nr:nuclear transport factor 2 family protein [Robertkochia sediminum]MBL7473800.1 nuclear transport factor 2 family protein [Robertkochia sediminum]